MPGFYGNNIIRTANQTRINVTNAGWTALQVGSTPQANRQYIRIQTKGVVGTALGVVYVHRALDGTYTAPTTNIKNVTVFRGTQIWVEPLGDNITIYGRMVAKAGTTRSSVEVIVTEFS